MKTLIPVVSLALCTVFAFSGCETTGDNVLLGAAAGAAIGGAATGHGRGALTGAAIGAASGYVVGKAVQHERRRAYSEGYYDARGDRYERYEDRRYDDDRYYREESRYPVGRPLGNGYVRSPYHPYNRIDVNGIPRGAKVQDPSTGKVFINP
jgi:osmotically inducible lipoprotein OsmB